MTYRADFFDRDGVKLRCRPCGYVIDFSDAEGRDAGWLEPHVGEHLPCPSCALSSRIPTAEESEWPNRKDRGDPMRGVPTTERPRA